MYKSNIHTPRLTQIPNTLNDEEWGHFIDTEEEYMYISLRKINPPLYINKIPRYITALSAVPQSIAIYTDPRGTQGRVRGNKRYGSYWKAKNTTGWKYYDYVNEFEFDLSKPITIPCVPFIIPLTMSKFAIHITNAFSLSSKISLVNVEFLI